MRSASTRLKMVCISSMGRAVEYRSSGSASAGIRYLASPSRSTPRWSTSGAPVPREEDHHRVVLLGRAREEGAQGPLDIAQGRRLLALVAQQEHVILPKAPGSEQDLVERLGVCHVVAERGDVRALVAPHPDDNGPSVA